MKWFAPAMAITMLGGSIAIVGSMVAVILATSMRDAHERQAIRAVLRGDCSTALRESSAAGSIPYHVTRACMESKP